MSFNLAGIGELLWDQLPGGSQLGGAPTNFAYHAHALGANALVVTRVGNDDLGREACRRLSGLGMSVECIEVDDAVPTGTASVELGADGQPHFIIHQNVAWDRLQGEAASRQAMVNADAVCFGTLAQRSATSAATVRTLVAASPSTALRIFDINLRQSYYTPEVVNESLGLANVLKVNETELPILAEMYNLTGDVRQQLAELAERFDLRAMAYTRGAGGSLLYADQQWSDHAGIAIDMGDAVGAGDAFTAAMTLGILRGWQLDLINHRANEVASHVASCAGATPPMPERLRAPFLSSTEF